MSMCTGRAGIYAHICRPAPRDSPLRRDPVRWNSIVQSSISFRDFSSSTLRSSAHPRSWIGGTDAAISELIQVTKPLLAISTCRTPGLLDPDGTDRAQLGEK